MTMEEVSRRYQIPIPLLRTYEEWGLCGPEGKVMGAWQYDDTDLERLSAVMTLLDIGFTMEEAESYMRLLLEAGHTERQRLTMLEAKRAAALEEIHDRERRLQRMDCLRHQLRKVQKKTGADP